MPFTFIVAFMRRRVSGSKRSPFFSASPMIQSSDV
jgi:hypothetical protein